MLQLLLSFTLNLLFFSTLGSITSKYFKQKIDGIIQILLGLIVTNTLLLFISIFHSIDSIILIFFILISFLIIIFHKKWQDSFFTFTRNKIPSCLITFGLLVGAFLYATRDQMVYDSGLYYLQNIKWISTYPAVPGLGNLHGRFGFNPSSFLINSLTSLEFLYGKAYFSLNLTILAILIFHYMRRIKEIFKASGLSGYLLFNIVIFCSILGMSHLISSPTPDFLATSLLFFIFTSYSDLQRNKNKSKDSIFPLLMLSLYLITLKLSTIPILILFVFILFEKRFDPKFLRTTSLMFFFIIGPWLARNVILTGWLIYPFPGLDLFSFDWKVPRDLVIREKQAITGWARVPGERFLWAAKARIWEWFPVWWGNLDNYKKIAITGALIFPPFAGIIQIIKNRNILKANPVIITAFSGVIFWFLMAPDIRFGKAFITISMISPLLIFQFSLKSKCTSNNLLSAILGLIFLGYTFSAVYNNRKIMNWDRFTVQEIPKPKDLQFEIYKLEDQVIYVPTQGDRCFNHQLPCTTPNTNLNQIELRGVRLQEGFRNISHSGTINELQ